MSGGLGSGSFAGSVARSVHEDLMAGVDESVQEGFGDDGANSERIGWWGDTWSTRKNVHA